MHCIKSCLPRHRATATSAAATPNSDASDEEFARLQAVFSEAEISELGFAVDVINAWNLINAGMRAPIPEAPAV